jgi:glycosyltransferase involved in cell wall biosynthesis
MRILVLANKFPYPAKDGGSIATLSLARSMANAGHQVTLLALNTSKHYTDPQTVPADLARLIRFISVPVNTDIRILKLARNLIFSRLPYNAERFISRDYTEKLEELLSTGEYDIVQMEGLYLAPYLDEIRRNSRAKVVMRAHNIEHEIWARTAFHQKGPKQIYLKILASRIRRMEYNYLNRFDAILPITTRDGEMLKNMGSSLPMHIVPTGIDTGDYLPDPSAMEFPTVFHIGALDWIPNQEGLLWFFDHVWGEVLRQFPSLRFYLAGRNAPEAFRSLGYPNLVYLGEVDNAHDFMRSKAVMVVPVLSGSGMRIKIIEGMALGKAIVTTTIGTEGINTTHDKDILVADDPGAFAECICRLVSDREYCLKIGENARIFVAGHYDNPVITEGLAGFYQKLIS